MKKENLENPDHANLKLSDPDSNEVPDNKVIDRDAFLRITFEQDARQGCALLFRQYYQPLCSHAARFVYSQSIAEDIVTEVFEIFWAKEIYKNIEISYRNYLYIAVRNTSLNYLKREFKKHSYLELSQAEDQITPNQNPYQHIKFDELSQLIETTIQSLAPKCQTVFVMSRFEGLKNREIAAQLNITEKAVEAHITKALVKLKSTMKTYL